MASVSIWGRALFASACAAVCALACDSVLDIEDPKMRGDATAGAGGEPTSGGTAATGGSLSGAPAGGADAGSGNQAGEPPAPNGGGGGSEEGGAAGASGAAGAAGMAGAGECEPRAARCAGEHEKSPEVCDDSGHWAPNLEQASGECPLLCSDGKCGECTDGDVRCAVCQDADADCSTNQPQKCTNGAWADHGPLCANYCEQGACETPPSCGGSFGGLTTCSNDTESCCESLLVPGGTFSRDYDASDLFFAKDQFPAEVSPFRLDKYEVTVGRMREFVSAFDQARLLQDGAGSSAYIANDAGWNHDFDLPADQAALIASLKCVGTTWSDTTNLNNDLPMNCVSYNVAYAFCIWDGGRLPTELEWNFAGTGGDEQRPYPWGGEPNAPETVTGEYGNYGGLHGGPVSVGSTPLGNGRWGQADLGGNVEEWVLDFHNDDYPASCHDCFDAVAAVDRGDRGGSYDSPPDLLQVSFRNYADPALIEPIRGFRCAREIEVP